MISIGHIVNPVSADPASDLVTAQPVTFHTMVEAKAFSQNAVDVSLHAVQCRDETRVVLPREFAALPDLARTIVDTRTFRQRRALPLIKDILDALYQGSSADYLVYTNVDIAVQPYFYATVAAIIQQGHEAFTVTRRTIADRYTRVEQVPMMQAAIGESHKGWDCFVFKRSLYPGFMLGTACIGSGWIGRILITNLAALEPSFKVFEDLHLTFHIGNRQAWKSPEWDDYLEHNRSECRRILEDLDRRRGPFDRDGLPGRFFALLDRS